MSSGKDIVLPGACFEVAWRYGFELSVMGHWALYHIDGHQADHFAHSLLGSKEPHATQ
jgi:hypothetical protein